MVLNRSTTNSSEESFNKIQNFKDFRKPKMHYGSPIGPRVPNFSSLNIEENSMIGRLKRLDKLDQDVF